jgi:Zn-finger nucleic acid-binding protein
MTDRQGVEIDYCPQCRGVWLDRGELDKIIERSAGLQPPPVAERRPEARYSSPPPRDEHDHEYRGDKHYGHGKEHPKKSLLKDLFDF